MNAQHFYLLNWYRFDNEILSQLVYRLKSDNSWPALGYYAKLLVPKVKVDWQNYAGLIPIPGSKSGSVHARLLAQEISYITGLPVIDVLIKKNEATEQKLKSAFERKNESSISLKKEYAEQFTKCIFVDDILTTGETFFQSNKAVKGSIENIIVTLFYRPKA